MNFNKKSLLLIFSLIICLFFSIQIFAAEPNVLIEKIIYYGKLSHNITYSFPGGKTVKLPVELNSWPGQFYDPPLDLLFIKAILKNNTNSGIKNLKINVRIRYQTGVLIQDAESINVKSSKKNLKWDKYIIDKKLNIPVITAKKEIIIPVGEVNLKKDLDELNSVGKWPWLCETQISVVNYNSSNTLSKVLPIEIIND